MSKEVLSVSVGSSKTSGGSGGAVVGGPKRRNGGGEGGPSSTDPAGGSGQSSRPRVSLASNMEPTYYIGGGNGNALIEETMNGLGWRRTKDKTDEGYRLRWCELKSSINYNTFKEGEQMVNHIPNCNLLTNKLGLLDSLQEYSRVCATVQKKGTLKLDFLPETYRLDDSRDRQTFIDTYKENEIWICKPTGRNQGKGIFLVRSLAELNQAVTDQRDQREEPTAAGEPTKEQPTEAKPQKPLNRIIQRYIINPLLVDGRKFDIRCYMLIANTLPYVVLYHKGYLRLSMYEYDNNCDNIIAHLTNQFIQKKDPKYSELKEETAWSMDRFNDYVNEKLREEKGLEKDWVYNTLTTTMTQIMTHTFMAVRHKLQRKIGYFDLYGLDFMIDENMKVWMIEVNVNPCLATNCAALREVVPDVVRETIHLAVECFEKSRKGRPILPLHSLKDFQMLHCESPASSASTKSSGPTATGGTTRTPTTNTKTQADVHHPSKSLSPVRRSRSISPVKEGTAKQTKKADPIVSLLPSASKGRPPSDPPSVRARRVVRAATAEPTGNNTTVPEEGKETETLQRKDDKERTGKTKSTVVKRKNTVVEVPEEKTTVRATPGSAAAKEGEKLTVGSAKAPAKSTAVGGESKNVKTSSNSNSPIALKMKKKQGSSENSSAVRDEKPNRGS